MLTIDQTYRWQGFGDGFGKWESRCRLRIFRSHPEAIVVVASDQGGDTGTTITNCAEHLATAVVKEYAVDPAVLTWIEHLPESEAQFSLVEFDWSDRQKASRPRWRYLTREEAEAIAGMAL